MVVRVHGRLNADDRVHLEQRDRRCRTLEVDLVENPWRQRRRVHFEADLECRNRVDVLFDNLVQTQLVGPELLVTKGVEPEHALPFGHQSR